MGAASARRDRRALSIAALATAPGRGALAILRLSGPDAATIAARVGVPADITPRHATRVTLHESLPPHERLDDAIAILYPEAQSPTGESLVEFSVHGGSYVSERLLAALMAAGAVPALPGEFTERAVRHGKLDLLQAEAVADLIEARSRATHRHALQQLSGALTQRLQALRSALLDVEALLAYDIDFPEEDDGPQPRAHIAAAATRVLESLDALRGTLPVSELGRTGVVVALAGAPNAGKSSLLNALVGEARAIVSDVPGTTRDAIDVLVDEDPYPWRLVDTAGLRETDDTVERLGVEVSERWLRRAQLILVCGEDGASLAAARAVVGRLSAVPQVLVRTKADLGSMDGEAVPGAVSVSAAQGTGLEELREAIRAAVRSAYPEPAEDAPVVTRARHVAAITRAVQEVEAFRAVWEADALPAPVAATHLRAAIHALDDLTGAIDIEDVLERVFRSFCVGK